MSLSRNKQNAGFTLTELMVALTLGLIILAGVSSVMVSNKKSYTAQDSLARLQENARTAMLIISRDLRNVGYWGCNVNEGNITNMLAGAASNHYFMNSNPLEGSEAGSNFYPSGNTLALNPAPRPGTDVIMIRGLDTSTDLAVTDPMPSSSQVIKVTDNSGLVQGDIVALSDCSSTDIFQITNVTDSGTGKDHIQHKTGTADSPGNVDLGKGADKLSKAFGTDAKLMRYIAHSYYVAPGASGEPSLYRQAVVGGVPQSQELVEGIENLQVLYGVDLDNDKLPDSYVKANLVGGSSWNNVVSMRFGLIARALANLQTSDLKTAATASQVDTKDLDIDGDGTVDFQGGVTGNTTTSASGKTVDDLQYQRRMFRTTILFRNLQR
jgi:type IV pilus assembly protein PilW